MLNKNIVKLAKSQVTVEISVPWTDLEPRWNETLQRLGQDLEIPGFRKGQAPAQMVEQQLGSRLQDEFLKTVQPEFLIEALKGSDIIPIDYPKYDLVSFVKGQNLQYKATITNRPAVSVGAYKTIKVGKPVLKPVTDEEVNKVIEDLFKRWKARSGAQTMVSGQGTGDPSTLRQAQGSGQVAPNGQTTSSGSISFGNQGMASTPSTLRQAQDSGQASSANNSSLIPDDNFSKAMGALDLNDLKIKLRKDLEDHSKYNNELDFEEAILQEVEKITTVELPDILTEDELQRMLVSLQRRVADMGLLLEDYLKNQNKTLDSLKSQWRPQAEKNVRMELGLSEIARMENVTVSDGELQAEIDKIQDARVKQQFEAQEPRLHLRHALRQTRTLNLLKTLVAAT